jgi:hypothetical protein
VTCALGNLVLLIFTLFFPDEHMLPKMEIRSCLVP